MDPPRKEFAPQVAWDPEVEEYLRAALGRERWERTAAALCCPPRATCLRVNTLKAPSAEEVLSLVRQQLGDAYPASAVYVHPKVPCAVILQGSGPHAVSYGDTGGREVVVSRKTGEAVLRGAPVYAPGVLAVSSGVSRGDLVALSLGMERPGSDTPEITRGTTLYDTPRGCGPVTSAVPAAAPEAGAAPEAPSASGAPAAAPQAASAAASDLKRGPSPDASPRDGTEANSTEGNAGAEGLPSTRSDAGDEGQPSLRARRRQKRRDHQAVAGGAEGVGAAGEGAGADVAQGQAPALGPGWTASSQGPVPPRTGLYLGVARAVMSRQEMFRCREGLALELVDPVYRVPPAAAGLPTGWAMLQNLPSLVAALALSPAPGSRVLDMCAAPGGKTTLLAAIMEDKGEIVAFDRTHAKAGEVVALAQEMGASCVRAFKMDAGKALLRPGAAEAAAAVQDAGTGGSTATEEPGAAPAAVGSSERADGGEGTTAEARAEPATASTPAAGAGGVRPPPSEKARLREERRRAAMLKRGITPPAPPDGSLQGGAYPAESFDAVLLDAPCSALGLRPRLQQQATALYLRQCSAAQRRLLDTAVRLLRVGGHLVYSTCTVNPGENEAVLRWLLDRYGASLRLVPAGPPFLGGPGLVGRHPSMAEAGRPLGGSGEAQAQAGAAEAGAEAGVEGAAAQAGCAGGGEAWLSEAEAALVQRFDPADPALDSIGFFVAKLLKTGPVEG